MTIFEKIYKSDQKQGLKDIIKKYKEKWFWVVNYLYFANLVSNGIIGKKKVNPLFLQALEKGDFLLPDGIALQMYYKKYFWISLKNLNGKDRSFPDPALSFFLPAERYLVQALFHLCFGHLSRWQKAVFLLLLPNLLP